jgi:hypothetical protein
VIVRRHSIDQRHAAGRLGACQISEFLGIAAGEIRVVVGLELFPEP